MGRRGFVLATALLVVVLIAALVAGVFFATMEESHIARTAAARELTLSAAEAAVGETISNWGDRTGQAIGVSGAELSTFMTAEMTVDVTVTRLDSTLFSIVAHARSLSSTSAARRRIGVVVSAQKVVDQHVVLEPIRERWWSELL